MAKAIFPAVRRLRVTGTSLVRRRQLIPGAGWRTGLAGAARSLTPSPRSSTLPPRACGPPPRHGRPPTGGHTSDLTMARRRTGRPCQLCQRRPWPYVERCLPGAHFGITGRGQPRGHLGEGRVCRSPAEEADTDWMSTVYVRDARANDEPTLARIFRRASLSNAGDREVLLADPEALTLS